MTQITWKQLQYGREQIYYKRLHPVLAKLRSDYQEFTNKSQQLERKFFDQLSTSIKIDGLDSIALLLKRLNKRLGIDLKVNLFLFQSPVCQAMCIPRYGLRQEDDQNGNRDELVILVTQHFLNELDANEQMSILGHELGHLLFGHVHIPASAVLESEFPLGNVKELKSDVLKWLTCAEISCDMIGILACGCDAQVFCQAMLKYTTGLNNTCIRVGYEKEDLVAILLSQLDEINSAEFNALLTTHPLTPLRLKLISSVAKMDLVCHFGQDVSNEALRSFQAEFNQYVDTEISAVYPEIIPEKCPNRDSICSDLCMAVAVSDGNITRNEIIAIQNIIGTSDLSSAYRDVALKVRRSGAAVLVEELVERAVRNTRQAHCPKGQILGFLRTALVVAASDGRIERCELEAIHAYAVHFGFSKQGIVAVLSQLKLR